MNESKNVKALKKQLAAAIAMVCVAAVALGSSTYAWFVSNNAVTAKGVDLSTTSSVPNLYITSSGKTTDAATAAGTNPIKLYPTSTNNANNFFETKHWTSGAENSNHAVADEYQTALTHEEGKTVYADYTFKLGVTNGTMDVYFDSSEAATTLAANTNMGTAARFAIKFNDGDWKMFKVKGTATNKGYYTDKNATVEGEDYWVTAAGDASKVSKATYADMNRYSGNVNDKGQAVAGAEKLATIQQGTTNEQLVTVRIWYEGCDKDCVSDNAANGITNAVTGNLGFVGVQTTTANSEP